MTEVLKTCDPAICEDLPNATSLPASEFGVTPCAAQDFPITEEFGQEVALANLSPRQAKEKGLLTSGTFGRVGSTLSNSAALTQSLASRLRQKVQEFGSTLYQMIWKVSVTPSGRRLPRLAASVRRTSENDCISALPTPTARDYRSGMSQQNLNRRLLHPRGVNLNEFMQRQLGRSGKLNPLFLCLLMGLPAAWNELAPSEMRLSRRKRKHS